MTLVLFGANLAQYFFGSTIFLTSLFLILLVLVQRGRGGGLTGALGGMGGQSAFGTKAGDTFTKVTMVTAAVWIVLCIGAIMFLGSDRGWGPSSGGTEITGSGSSDDDGGAGGMSADSEDAADTTDGGADAGGADAGGADAGADDGGDAGAGADDGGADDGGDAATTPAPDAPEE
jgi:preprotein translocase subunit SecG